MNWEHACSLDWLRERQGHLTASDVRSLLPVTRTGRRREVGRDEYMRVLASKLVALGSEDCMSYGAAARGHILEPYAIDALNEMLVAMQGGKSEMLYWWDDKLVCDGDRSLAFSPDAMDVPMGTDFDLAPPTAIAEVKCYSDERHVVTAYTPKERMEERWQIATAMAVCDDIDHAWLVLFDPRMLSQRTHVIRFDRSDLYGEIDMILEVECAWDDFLEHCPVDRRPPNDGIHGLYGSSETDIILEQFGKCGLNP